MAVNNDYVEFIKDQLSDIGEIETKNMFGGVGFFKDGKMFGMIGNDVFRLKTDEVNKEKFIKAGMKPYFSKSKKKGMPYWEVPENIIEDRSELKKWAEESIAAAHR